MKLTRQKLLGYANLALGALCLLAWLFNSLGWVGLGDPAAQLILAPVCLMLGAMLLRTASQKT